MSDYISSKQVDDKALSEAMWIDRWGFLTCVIIGAIWIIATKSLGIDQLIITPVTIALMVFYAVIIWKSPRFSLREDQAGDNLYYLGLLLTLVSLGYALFVFDVSIGTQQIVQSFGLALATTIAGLTLRVWFNQMRQNLVQVEQETRFALVEATNRLRAELDQTVLNLNDFCRTAIQSTSDGLAEIRERVETEVNKSVETVSTSHADVGERLRTAFERLEGHANEFQGSAEEMVSSVVDHTKALDDIAKGATALDQNINALVKATTTAEHGLKALIKRTSEMVTAQNTLQDALTAGSALLDKQNNVTDELQRVVSSIGNQMSVAASRWEREVDDALNEISSKNEKSLPLFKSESDKIHEQHSLALQNLSDATDQISKILHAHKQSLEVDLGQTQQLSHEIQASFKEMAEAILAHNRTQMSALSNNSVQKEQPHRDR